MHNVPICVECAVGEARLERTSGVDPFEEGIVITTKLKLPRGAGLAEFEKMVKEASDR